MHAREHVQLAGVLSFMGPQLIADKNLVVPDDRTFWVASRSRVQAWNNQFCAPQSWSSMRPVLEEILASEVLTRVWCGLALVYDDTYDTADFGVLAQASFLAHQEARNRTMRMMVSGTSLTTHQTESLNRIRRRAERWSDMMIASFLPHVDVDEIAFDIRRAEDFAQDLQFDRPADQRLQMWKIILTGVSSSFKDLDDRTANHELNHQIAAGILECVPKQCQYDSPFAHLLMKERSTIDRQTGWYERMNTTTNDAQELVENLLAE